jgi:hypothetical protein
MKEYFLRSGLVNGRIISNSKSFYREKFPENEVYFNANIFVLGEGKVWYGDLDLTKDFEILKDISLSSGKDLYILKEFDGRFEGENLNDSEIIKRAITKINK